MALIFDSRFRAIDSNGDPLVGATLTIYDAGTLTLASVYRDEALTDPMTNPSSGADVSDSGGWFPQIFTSEGDSFDITLKTSAGVTVKTYVDVPALGSNSGAVTRDFGNSRLRISGSGGVVSLEGGDPSGDDVGGQVRIGGYLGTQADEVTLDAATTETTGALNTSGRITENSKKLTGVVYASSSFSSVASVTIPLTSDPTGVRVWELEIFDIVVSATADITLTLSFDDGGSFASSNYWTRNIRVATGPTVSGIYTSSGASTSCTLYSGFTSGTYGSGTGNTITGEVRIRIVAPVTAGFTRYMGESMCVDGSAGNYATIAGFYGAASAPATHAKIAPSTGTFSGKYRLVPLRGYGEA